MTTNSSITSSEQFGNVCVGNWTADFTISIDYISHWNASYLGSNTGLRNVTGSYSGVGPINTEISMDAYGVTVVTFCATARKMDSSFPISPSLLISLERVTRALLFLLVQFNSVSP
jgi:hypothetical protein